MTPEVVVFDFDGTLTCRDSFLDFCVRYCLQRPARFLLLAPLAPLALLLLMHSQGAAGSVLLWAMTVGTSPREFLDDLKRYARRTLPLYAHDAIFGELTRHVSEGRRVLIATGSVPVLARELLAARGLGRVSTVGTRLERRCGGFIARVHCTGYVKLAELQRRFGVTAWSCVYTNSFSDRALMTRASRITLVCPSERTLKLTTRLAGAVVPLNVLRPERSATA
jgi:phosphatidylglycerophosphatase C